MIKGRSGNYYVRQQRIYGDWVRSERYYYSSNVVSTSANAGWGGSATLSPGQFLTYQLVACVPVAPVISNSITALEVQDVEGYLFDSTIPSSIVANLAGTPTSLAWTGTLSNGVNIAPRNFSLVMYVSQFNQATNTWSTLNILEPIGTYDYLLQWLVDIYTPPSGIADNPFSRVWRLKLPHSVRLGVGQALSVTCMAASSNISNMVITPYLRSRVVQVA